MSQLHEWTETEALPSGARCWHCTRCRRTVQADKPEAGPCDGGGRPYDFDSLFPTMPRDVRAEARLTNRARRRCAHYEGSNHNMGREVGRLVLTTLHPDRTGLDQVEVFLCNRCCEELRHFVAFRSP